jgi:hypothetical protein
MTRAAVRAGAASLSAMAALVLPLKPAAGQAICSAPHSSPTLAQSGSLETLPAGAGWFQLTVYGQTAGEFFNPLGDRQPFLADSEFRTRSAFVTGAVGVTEGVELWAQAPIHRLTVDGASGSSTSSGVGDLRFAVRVGSRLAGIELPVAIRAGLKLPGSEFPVDATVLPLTEGQRDLELSVESGFGIAALPLYAMGWMGFRWRGPNKEAVREPGDELFAHLALGGAAGPIGWEIAADGLWGRAPIAQSVVLEGEKRRLVQIRPTIGVGLGPGRLELTGQVPVLGRNLPVGTGVSLGYRQTWGL